MTAILYLIPISLALAVFALVGFFWTVRTGQYDDVEGDSERMLDTEDKPLANPNDRGRCDH